MKGLLKEKDDYYANINRLTALPRALITDDGRELRITSWTTTAKFGQGITVEVDGFIEETRTPIDNYINPQE